MYIHVHFSNNVLTSVGSISLESWGNFLTKLKLYTAVIGLELVRPVPFSSTQKSVARLMFMCKTFYLNINKI